MIEAALRVHVKARRLLLVEGAESDEASPALLELHALADDLHDVGVAPDTVERLLSDHRRCPNTSPRGRLDYSSVQYNTRPVRRLPLRNPQSRFERFRV